jgi:hypothetical protein
MDICGLDRLVPEVEGKGDDQADLGDNCEGMMMNECRKTIQFIRVADGCSGPNVADQLLCRCSPQLGFATLQITSRLLLPQTP